MSSTSLASKAVDHNRLPSIEKDHALPIEQSILPLRNIEAVRSPAFGTTASQTGAIVHPVTRSVILTESSAEKNLVRTLLADRKVVDVRHQALAITYVGEDGLTHEHVVDLVATYRDGTRVGYVVKKESHAVKHNTRGLVQRLASAVSSNEVCRLQLVTDRNMPEWSNLNARQLLNPRRDRRTHVDVMVRELAPELMTPIRIGDLTARLGGGAVAFRPVLRAIHFGTLEYLGIGRITPDSFVAFSGTVQLDTDLLARRPDIHSDAPAMITRKRKKAKPYRRARYRKV